MVETVPVADESGWSVKYAMIYVKSLGFLPSIRSENWSEHDQDSVTSLLWGRIYPYKNATWPWVGLFAEVLAILRVGTI